MRRRRSELFQLWVAQYIRSLFVVYSGGNYMTSIAIKIQYRYYYVKYQLYDNLPDLLPIVQYNVIYWGTILL